VWTAVRVDAQPFVYGLTCDNNKDDKKTYNAKNGGSYTVACGVDYWGGDLSSAQTSTFEACMDTCDTTAGCLDVSYSSGTCYMKSVLNTASTASWVWTGRKVTEVPLDLTNTQIYSNYHPADTHITKEVNLFSQTMTGNDNSFAISTRLYFLTIPNTVYEISFEYYQEAGRDQVSFIEVGDTQGYLATLAWYQSAQGTKVLGGPSYGNAIPSPAGRQLNTCWNNKIEPSIAPTSGTWQTGTVILYSRTTQGYFRRDQGGLGTQSWRNVYVRQKTNDFCSITQ
jgi:hypothetical protein